MRIVPILSAPPGLDLDRSVVVFVAWLAGIALARALSLPRQVLPVLGLTAFIGLVLRREDARVQGYVRLGACCTLTLALGAGRFSQYNYGDAVRVEASWRHPLP